MIYVHTCIFYINCPQQFIFKKSVENPIFFRKLNLYLVTLFNVSLLYKLIHFGFFLFEITLNDFIISLLLPLRF